MSKIQIRSNQDTCGSNSSDMLNTKPYPRRNWTTTKNIEIRWISCTHHQERYPRRWSYRNTASTTATTSTSSNSPQKENILHISLLWTWNSDPRLTNKKIVSEVAPTHRSPHSIQEARPSQANVSTYSERSGWIKGEQRYHLQSALQELWSRLHRRNITRSKQKNVWTPSSD